MTPTPTPADRLALALCRAIARDLGGEASSCHAPCPECREQSARPPLWRVMRRAESSCASDLSSPEAQMIRAVRDWLVPEESAPSGVEFWADTDSARKWQHNRRLRAILTAEIDRAELREGANG